MKKLLCAVLFMVTLIYMGCNKDDSNPVVGPSDITFQLSSQTVNGVSSFLFKPSENVKLDVILLSCPSQSVYDTIASSNPNRVYSKDSVYPFGDYSGIQRGQNWNFTFTGKTSGNNTSFSSSVSFSVPKIKANSK